MKGRSYYLAFLLLLANLTGRAQTEGVDSLSFDTPAMDVNYRELPGKSIGTFDLREHHWSNIPETAPMQPYNSARPLDLQIKDFYVAPGQARLARWNGGMISATGGVASFPGLMQIESGTIGIYQTLGRFTFHAGGKANKYGYLNGLNTQYGLEGDVTYNISPRLSLSVFGTYYFGSTPAMPPAVMGYYGRTTFGGAFDYKINDYWGVKAGVQTVQQLGTRRFEAEPIATPYYKINKKVKIGLPVGQILYHILKR